MTMKTRGKNDLIYSTNLLTLIFHLFTCKRKERIMKAKEYAERYKSEGMTDESLIKVCHDMFCEAKELIEMRHITTDGGMYAVFKELSQKWKAFANMFDHVNKKGFELYIETLAPELYQMIKAHEIYTELKRK